MRAAFVAAALIGAIGLAGCASSGDEPAWLSGQDGAADGDYPSLRDVPRRTSANTNARHWSEAEAELRATGQAVRSHPRAQPATAAEDPNAFLDEARRDLEETRESHEP